MLKFIFALTAMALGTPAGATTVLSGTLDANHDQYELFDGPYSRAILKYVFDRPVDAVVNGFIVDHFDDYCGPDLYDCGGSDEEYFVGFNKVDDRSYKIRFDYRGHYEDFYPQLFGGMLEIGDHFYDHTLVSFDDRLTAPLGYRLFVSLLPDPQVWLSMIAGFALIGLKARRRPSRALA